MGLSNLVSTMRSAKETIANWALWMRRLRRASTERMTCELCRTSLSAPLFWKTQPIALDLEEAACGHKGQEKAVTEPCVKALSERRQENRGILAARLRIQCFIMSSLVSEAFHIAGEASGDHPTSQSIKEFFERVDQTAIAAAAKRLKKQGEEHTYAAIATARPSRNALDDAPERRRLDFAKHVISLSRRPQWYYDNLARCDLCNSVHPRAQKTAQDVALARRGKKGWMSKGSQAQSQHLRGPKRHLKLNSSDAARARRVPVFARGKLHIEPLPGDFLGETPLGAEIMVAKVRAALNVRFPGGGRLPRALADRGGGICSAGSGAIAEEYRGALRRHDLRAFFPADVSALPSQLQQVMPRETAASWTRDRHAKTPPMRCWEETSEAHRARLKACAAQVNCACDVDGLRRELPPRVKDLDRRRGDRLAK
ncbi:unnamed protein product [Prorocentrum cordatum]|uniref:Uncharacterized protein n=1 Tax=Prorocentrum cordatum TaxID=2364126 RepID=A0ABN9WVE6_9DINO|nr:unnamed protein product [Polarella glacialis]